MKAVIRFIKPDNKLAIFTKFLEIIQGVDQLRQHILAHGILLESLSPSEIASLESALKNLEHSEYTITAHSLRLMIAQGEFDDLIKLVIPIPLIRNEFAEIFWEKGFAIDHITRDQTVDFQQRLAAIATVTGIPDVLEPKPLTYTVSGQIRHLEGTPFTDNGYTVHAFDVIAPDNLFPLGNPASINSNGGYSISYPWQSDSRNGPDLVVQLFNPENKVVTQHREPGAKIKETLNLIVKQSGPRTFNLTGIVKNQATGAVLPNLQVEAQFRANNAVLLTLTSITDTNGIVNISFDEKLLSKLPAGQQVEVIFMVSQD